MHVVEVAPPDGEAPVSWLLATRLPVDIDDAVADGVDVYRARWPVEVWIKALKAGCADPQRQLESLDALLIAVGLLAPISTRLLALRWLGRNEPERPASDVLEDDEVACSRGWERQKRRRLPQAPTVGDVLLAVARLGGVLTRDKVPGWSVLGRGFEDLSKMAAMFRAMQGGGMEIGSMMRAGARLEASAGALVFRIPPELATLRARLRLAVLHLLLLAACTPDCPKGSVRRDDGLCHLVQTDDTADPETETGEPETEPEVGLEGFELGDPIVTLGYYGIPAEDGPPPVGDGGDAGGDEGGDPGGGGDGGAGPEPANPDEAPAEWLDGAVLDETHALVVGEGGWAIVDLDAIEYRENAWAPRGYRLGVHDGLAVIGTHESEPYMLDVSDPTAVVELGELPVFGGYYEDVAVHAGTVLFGWKEQGALLVDASGTLLGSIPAGDAFGVGLHEGRAVVTDGTTVGLWDVTDPSTPLELDTADIGGIGRDVAFDGNHLVVATGGDGVSVFAVQDDTLVHRGDLWVPGSSFSVSLDGDHLWMASWDTVAVAWLGESGPVILGHEEPVDSAMAIAAGFGRAVIGDWNFATSLLLAEGLAGPELVIPGSLALPSDDAQTFVVRNAGPWPLTLRFGEPPAGVTVEPAEVVLEPESAAGVVITPPAGGLSEAVELAWTSDDPDEPSGTVRLETAATGVGTEHADFELSGFAWPDPSIASHRLADERGKVVFLAYFAVF